WAFPVDAVAGRSGPRPEPHRRSAPPVRLATGVLPLLDHSADRVPAAAGPIISGPGADDAGRIAAHERVGWDVTRHHAARRDQGALADRDPAYDRGVGPDARAPLDERWHDVPLAGLEQLPSRVDCPRVAIVGETHVGTDEGALLDGHARGNEGERFDLHVPGEPRATLDFDERGDPAVVADEAAIEIDQLRVVNDNACAKLY